MYSKLYKRDVEDGMISCSMYDHYTSCVHVAQSSLTSLVLCNVFVCTCVR